MRLLLVAIACVAVVGCATRPVQPVEYTPPHVPYNDSDHAWSTATGTASIAGQAFLRTNGGEVRTCAGNEVKLVPDGPYTEEILAMMLAGKNVMVEDAFPTKQRVTQCDAQGNFKFTALPAGKWIIQTTVIWKVPDVYTGGLDEQGGSLESPVTTSKTEASEILLTDRNLTAQKFAF